MTHYSERHLRPLPRVSGLALKYPSSINTRVVVVDYPLQVLINLFIKQPHVAAT